MELVDNNSSEQRGNGVSLNRAVNMLDPTLKLPDSRPDYLLWHGDVERLLDRLPKEPLFDLVVTSPPYNLGKSYETIVTMDEYRRWQARIIRKIVPRLKSTGSICWQVGNYTASNGGGERGSIHPLDYLFHPLFEKHGLILRNRIVWRFGHGLHNRYRFSGRYEVVLWYT
ncbi:MAG: DNA methyltransferase, partial [Ktedonobacterales bacterium]